jgi:iron complex transport system substrate-binding protein
VPRLLPRGSTLPARPGPASRRTGSARRTSLRSPVRAALLTGTFVVMTLAACAAPADDADLPGEDAVAATPAPGSGDYPLTLDNCGTEVTVNEPPERVLTVKSSATETVLALGLGEVLVGAAFPDGPLPEWLGAEGADVPVIAERLPSHEVVLEAEPDLVYAGWESAFAADAAGERERLAELGIGTYVAPSACRDPAYQPDSLSFEEVFAHILEAGDVLGAPDAARELVDAQRARLEAVEPSTAGLSALWYSSGSDTPYVGAGIGAPQMILQAAGLRNIAADVADTWSSLSWEAVAERNPDVIVLVDSSWNTAEHKKEVLEGNPTTAALPAVQAQRYIVVPFPASEAGVRNVEAVESVLGQLAALEDDGA